MDGRGYAVTVAHDVAQAVWSAEQSPPEFAVVDLRMPGPSGLTLVKKLRELSADTRVVVLTGYASIATAIEAIKIGATHYLAKPVTAEEIIAAFGRTMPDPEVVVAHEPLPVNRVEWEHIQKVLMENQGNISATAKALGMHRRTLQRKLVKRPAKA
jgi:two-component system response regulator RegA